MVYDYLYWIGGVGFIGGVFGIDVLYGVEVMLMLGLDYLYLEFLLIKVKII